MLANYVSSAVPVPSLACSGILSKYANVGDIFRRTIKRMANPANTYAARLADNKDILYDADRAAAWVKQNKGRHLGVELQASIANQMTDSAAPFVGLGVEAPLESIIQLAQSKVPANRRQFLGFAIGTAGRSIKPAVPYEYRRVGNVLNQIDKTLSPYTDRYGTSGVISNPATYGLLAQTMPQKLRRKLAPLLYLGGAAGTAAVVGDLLSSD